MACLYDSDHGCKCVGMLNPSPCRASQALIEMSKVAVQSVKALPTAAAAGSDDEGDAMDNDPSLPPFNRAAEYPADIYPLDTRTRCPNQQMPDFSCNPPPPPSPPHVPCAPLALALASARSFALLRHTTTTTTLAWVCFARVQSAAVCFEYVVLVCCT